MTIEENNEPVVQEKVPSSTISWKKNKDPYRTGDGDVVYPPRPGSMHAYTLPSRGLRT